MRRIVMFNWLTADGYFARPDGNLQWVVPEGSMRDDDTEGERRDWLLELDPALHRDQIP